MLNIRPLNLKAHKLTSLFSQGIGFMFHLQGKNAKLFEFQQERQVGIHMLFVFFPLIVIWLDKKKRIKHFALMKPFISLKSHKAKYVLEAPYRAKIMKKIQLNKLLSW